MVERSQRFEVLIESSEKLEGLNTLLTRLFKDINIDCTGTGAKSGERRVNNLPVPPIDFGTYRLSQDSRNIGIYEFTLRDDHYDVILDLSGLEKKTYDVVINTVERQYPQFSTAIRV